MRGLIDSALTLPHLNKLWEAHRSQVTIIEALARSTPEYAARLESGWFEALMDVLRERSIKLGGGAPPQSSEGPGQLDLKLAGQEPSQTAPAIETSCVVPVDEEPIEFPTRPSPLAFPKTPRARDPEHLAFIRTQPCVICGRSPSHAHHIRYAQPRAMARKVSDEYTVPLCFLHHHDVHKTGKEQDWWKSRGIDPMAVALELWRATRKG